LTFSGVNGALWPRLAARFPDAAIPQACFSSTVELRSQHQVSHELGASDASNLYRYLVRRGIVAGTRRPLPRLKSAPTPISGMDVGYCPVAGFIVYRLAAGAKLKRGDVVCEIIDPADPRGPKARTPMAVAHRRHAVLPQEGRRARVPGMVAFRIAGPKPLAHRKGMSGLDD
jgi:predicted deacylase